MSLLLSVARDRGALLWALAFAAALSAFLRQTAPDSGLGVAAAAFALAGVLLQPVEARRFDRAGRWIGRAAGVVVLAAVGVLYILVRSVLADVTGAPLWVDVATWVLLIGCALAGRDGARRILRLIGIEGLKLRRSRMFKVGLLTAALVTLFTSLATDVNASKGQSGWWLATQTLGKGFWVAEVFLLVFGAVSLAGEIGQGTLKMILPHAYRRSEWIAAKATVLVLAAIFFALLVAIVAVGHAELSEGLGDVVKPIPPQFGEEEGGIKVHRAASVMAGHLVDTFLVGLAALIVAGLLGLFFSSLFDSVVPALSATFLLFLGLALGDVFLGFSREVLQKIYAWYPGELRELTGKIGSGLDDARWNPELVGTATGLAFTAAALTWLCSVALFARRDLHG